MSNRRGLAYGRLFYAYEDMTDCRIRIEIPLRPWKPLARDAWFVTVKVPFVDARRFPTARDRG